MELYINPERAEWPALCSRPSDDGAEIRERVEKIIKRVREGGDRALAEIAREIDGTAPEMPEVAPETIAAAASAVPENVRKAIQRSEGAHV